MSAGRRRTTLIHDFAPAPMGMINSVPRFPMGQILATPGALIALQAAGEQAATYLNRHSRGDWGEIDADDWKLNDEALRNGSRLLSAYTLRDGKTKIWIITEARGDDGRREATTILLPQEY